MYKTVSFNIFEEHLEDIVYGESSDARRRESVPANEENENPTRKPTEIIIKPLNETRRDRQSANT